MRKIRLDVDDLAVESFETRESKNNQSGTVKAHEVTYIFEGCGQTQFQTCAWTNGAPCFC